MTPEQHHAAFAVGEVARHVADPAVSCLDVMQYDGQDCEIIGGLEWRECHGEDASYFGYDCRFSDGTELLCAPHELRKKQPPDELAAWTEALDCIDRAMRVVEVES